jgi:septal ring factor EnvC (AmiA/AmiB activator)
MDQAQKILKLEAELKEKATSQVRSDTENQKLTKDLAQKTVEDAKSKAKVQDLQNELSTCQKELHEVSTQLENLQMAEIDRFKKSSDWAAAARIFETVVKSRERKLAAVKAAKDDAKAKTLSKDLCSSYRQLGEIYLNLKGDSLSKAESYTRKALAERVKLLGLGAPECLLPRSSSAKCCERREMM